MQTVPLRCVVGMVNVGAGGDGRGEGDGPGLRRVQHHPRHLIHPPEEYIHSWKTFHILVENILLKQ